MKLIYNIIATVIVFGILNLALYWIQEAWHYKDNQKITKITQFMERKEIAIKDFEQSILRQQQQTSVEKNHLDSLLKQNRIDEYNKLVDNYNSKLKDLKSNISLYDKQMNDYNRWVKEANDFFQKVGPRWYIIPVPRMARRTITRQPVKI